MSTVISIAGFLFMLVILVFVHELGHFVTALRMGIRVEEFGIGYPPRALTLMERKGVKYTLNWLPLGGFVRFGGEDETLYGVGSLAQAPPWRKIPVMVAGPLMNLLLAMVIFAALFAISGVPTQTGAEINEVYNGPAAAGGLQKGDVLLSLGGVAMDQQNTIGQIASQSLNKPLVAVVERDGKRLDLSVTPGPWTDPQGKQLPVGLGISYSPLIENRPTNLLDAIWKGVLFTFGALLQMISGIGQLIGGLFGANEPPAGGLAGPIGIARVTGEVIEQGGLAGFWRLMAFLSLNLFLLNLLPIPALDGSHIMFSLIEWVRGGKKVPPEKEALVHAIGFASLMALMLVVSISDILNAINGRSVLGGG